jgi:hypothetical protein
MCSVKNPSKSGRTKRLQNKLLPTPTDPLIESGPLRPSTDTVIITSDDHPDDQGDRVETARPALSSLGDN